MNPIKRVLGRALNAVGAPGFIRVSNCREQAGLPVEVSVDDTFTTVSISNLRLLFRRVSGKLDGVVVTRDDCARSGSVIPTARAEVSETR